MEDRYYLERVVAAGELKKGDPVIEIGPGDGRLTELLLGRGARVTAVEIDPRWAVHLRNSFHDNANFQLVEKDFLKLTPAELATLFPAGQPVKIIANLPYYVTTPILTRLLELREAISLIVVMVQKEVGLRLSASVGKREAGAVTLYLQYYTTLEIINTVPASAFRPRPKVDSVILKIEPRTSPAVKVGDEVIFWTMIKAAFGQRRKTLVNALAALKREEFSRAAVESGLKYLKLPPRIRGENLSLEEFASLCDYLTQ